jgi:MFS family permease
MALANLAVFGGAFFTPIVVGKITHTIGWEWSFYFVTIFSGVCLPLVFFFVPETAFRRSAHFNTDLASTDDIRLYQKPSEEAAAEKNGVQSENQYAGNHFTGANTNLKTFGEKLMPFSGRLSDENFWKLVFRPLPLFAHPAIFWACLIQGMQLLFGQIRELFLMSREL